MKLEDESMGVIAYPCVNIQIASQLSLFILFILTNKMHVKIHIPCRVGLVISVSASHTICHEFASRPGHTKDHHKNGTNCLPAWHATR